MATDPALIDALRGISTATLTMQLLKRGVRRSWMAGTKPLQPGGQRLAGPAFTLRFVPGREDVSTRESYAAPNSLRDAIEAMPEGVVAVIDSRGEQGAGTLGDILAGRMKKRGVAGIVSDGPMRDVAGVRAIDIPVWCNGAAAPPSIAALWFAGRQEPIGCGGVAVFPDDLVVADDDGAVVLPRALAAEIAEDGAEQEALEAWILTEIERGEPVKGLYPPDDAALARYRAAKSEQD
ncbi:MAG: ribonuclease activity regulator RraA [Rhodospirillaceae bacterium]|nr:ribonuclease activity regulator RraA [Rhodospirillaceae bacterium]MYJ70934.1 ribonuclease activity regulator RraA [Rhodospirillaceae bacterium]